MLGKSWFYLVKLSDPELLHLCQRDSFKGSGAGGQKKNKTSSGVRLTYLATQVTESGARSRLENEKKALKKLRLKLATEVIIEGQVRPAYPRAESCIHPYVHSERLRINEKNPDFPLVVGAILDVMASKKGDMVLFSEILGVSKSQVYKFFESHPSLKETFNQLKKFFYEQSQ